MYGDFLGGFEKGCIIMAPLSGVHGPADPVPPLPQNLRIAVITHAMDEFERGGYLLHRLIGHWEARGTELKVVKGPADSPPDADLAVCHVDMTAVGDEYARMFEHYPLVINGRILDISKSVFSDQLVRLEDGYQGPVIVKTDRNFGGMRELRLRLRQGDSNAQVNVQRPWRKIEFLPAYPVFASPADVPLGVWRNPRLVVEKFRPERNEDGTYRLRVWIFCGDRGIYYQCISGEPIIKSHNTVRRENLDVADLPEALRVKREKLGFDFGKFDFGIVDGEAVLYDVNRTPGSPRGGGESSEAKKNIIKLSEGLDHFIRKLTP